MTAEIAIMNKMGVALAADSAVTIRSSTGQKIYNTNKLFMLSRHQPVGIMLFGDAEMMRVPWETIIKSYRRDLGDVGFDTLEEYGRHFIAHLDKNTSMFPEQEQERWLYQRIGRFLLRVRRQIDQEVETVTHKKGAITEDQVTRIVSRVIKRFHTFFEGLPILSTIPPKFDQEVWSKHPSTIEQAINDAFGTLPLSKVAGRHLKRLCGNLLIKDHSLHNYSGIVISGFGTKDIFPSLYAYQLEGLINDTLRWRAYGEDTINRDSNASVSAFAQDEMARTFMEGMDPIYKNFLRQYLTALFDKYPEDIAKDLPKLTTADKKTLIRKIKTQSKTLVDDFITAISEHGETQLVKPIINTVEFLPLTELALMAEALVNLTSFKRRVTMVAETVGGPIDVAVISKGDGFIWIKRKQYFDAASNQHFYANYFR